MLPDLRSLGYSRRPLQILETPRKLPNSGESGDVLPLSASLGDFPEKLPMCIVKLPISQYNVRLPKRALARTNFGSHRRCDTELNQIWFIFPAKRPFNGQHDPVTQNPRGKSGSKNSTKKDGPGSPPVLSRLCDGFSVSPRWPRYRAARHLRR